jgi:glycine/D-amino acid oxidase-like deaminating enzyme
VNDGSTPARAPSLWLDPPPDPVPPLEGEVDADVVVIGAGYTGLWTALALRERGAEVVVLERDYAGFGASGRNAGHLTPTIGKDLPTLMRVYGRERGGALVRFAETAVEHVEAAISERKLDCDYVPAGNVLAGLHSGQRPGLEKAAAAARELGAAMRLLDPAELAERGLPRFVACGYLEERGGVLHPGKYVRAVRERAIDAGVRLFESTPVDAIADGPQVRVETPRGAVSAPICVIATNAYTPRLGRLRFAVAPLHVSLFATAPLAAEQRERVGWAGGEGIYTAHEVLESYRLTVDGRIVGGSRHVRWAYGGRALPDHDPEVFAALEAMFRRRFPELADVPVERCWSGPIAMTPDFLPAIGRGGRHDNVLFGIGYNGHGVAQASYAGTLLAKIASGEDPGHLELLGRRRLRMAPEPLRSLGMRAILATLASLDRRTDRRAQPRA